MNRPTYKADPSKWDRESRWSNDDGRDGTTLRIDPEDRLMLQDYAATAKPDQQIDYRDERRARMKLPASRAARWFRLERSEWVFMWGVVAASVIWWVLFSLRDFL